MPMTDVMTGIIETGPRVVITVGSRWRTVTARDDQARPRLLPES